MDDEVLNRVLLAGLFALGQKKAVESIKELSVDNCYTYVGLAMLSNASKCGIDITSEGLTELKLVAGVVAATCFENEDFPLIDGFPFSRKELAEFWDKGFAKELAINVTSLLSERLANVNGVMDLFVRRLLNDYQNGTTQTGS